MRRGGDPRLPLELALVKATRPGSDLSRESLAHRLELLEDGHGQTVRAGSAAQPNRHAGGTDDAAAPPTDLGLEQLQEAWQRTILPAVSQRSMPPARCSRRRGRRRSPTTR